MTTTTAPTASTPAARLAEAHENLNITIGRCLSEVLTRHYDAEEARAAKAAADRAADEAKAAADRRFMLRLRLATFGSITTFTTTITATCIALA